jgi:acyl-CoA thioesterase
VSDFADVTALRARAGEPYPDRAEYDVDLHPGWAIRGKPNGGYLLAMLARAGCLVVGTRDPLAVSAHYLRAPNPGPAEIRAQVIRRGRRVSTSRASMWQGGKVCIETLISSGRLPEAPAEWSGRPAPAMPAPEDCVEATAGAFTVELLDHIELRIDPATAPKPRPTGTPVVRFWFRLRDGAEPDVLTTLLAVDSGPPTIFNLARYGWAPTVELTVLVRGAPAPGWMRCESHATLLGGGWFDEEAALWDSTGALVAQARQLALTTSEQRPDGPAPDNPANP